MEYTFYVGGTLAFGKAQDEIEISRLASCFLVIVSSLLPLYRVCLLTHHTPLCTYLPVLYPARATWRLRLGGKDKAWVSCFVLVALDNLSLPLPTVRMFRTSMDGCEAWLQH